MKTKRLFALLLTAVMLLLASCAAQTTGETPKNTETPAQTTGEAQESTAPSAETPAETTEPAFEGENVRLALLSGSTGLGASKLIVDASAKKTVNTYVIDVIADPTQVVAGVKTGKYDLAALPVNVAAKLYNMPDVDVRLVALNTLGVLYMLENEGETVQSFSDLAGKTVYTTGEGATPQYILEYLLAKNNVEDVTVVYRATADEVQADLQTAGAIAMLPQPKATVVTMSMSTVRYALDMTEEWNKVSSVELTQGCVIATKAFAEEHKDALDAFLAEYEASIEFVKKADDDAAEAVVNAGIIGKAPIAKNAIPKSNLVCYTGEKMKETMTGTLSVLFASDPKSIGGNMPGDDFYYAK